MNKVKDHAAFHAKVDIQIPQSDVKINGTSFESALRQTEGNRGSCGGLANATLAAGDADYATGTGALPVVSLCILATEQHQTGSRSTTGDEASQLGGPPEHCLQMPEDELFGEISR